MKKIKGLAPATQSLKGFTLIELLIVIGILAILATTVVLVINPAEKLKETRDTQRISDLRTLKDAIGLYLVRASSPDLSGGAGICISGGSPSPVGSASVDSLGTNPLYPEQPFNYPAISTAMFDFIGIKTAIDGTGWITIIFNNLGSSPISRLPVDPLDATSVPSNATLAGPLTTVGTPLAAGYFYAYKCSGLTFEINTNMESLKYAAKENTDGGTTARVTQYCSDPHDATCDSVLIPVPNSNSYFADRIYEVGNAPGLAL